MSIYRFGNDSTVTEIVMRKSAGGGVRTFLFARKDATPEQIDEIKKLLDTQGWQYVANDFEGRPALEMRGIKKIEPLTDILKQKGLASNDAIVTTADNPHFTMTDKFKNNLLLISGILNIAADVGFVLYGYLKQKLEPAKPQWEEQAAGIAYAAGSLSLASGGHGDHSDHHIKIISSKLYTKLQQEAVAMPAGCAIHSFIHSPKRTPFGEALHTLQKHPSEVGNAFTGLAGAFIAAGARKSDDPKTKLQDGILGFSTFLAGGTAAIVKERPFDPTRPAPTNIFEKAQRWVEERPNRVAGFGYMISTFMHGSETFRHMADIKNKKIYADKSTLAWFAYSMRAVFTSFNLIAEGILTLVHKGEDKSKKAKKYSSVEDSIYAIAADIVIHQSTEKQEPLIAQLSEFLSDPEILGGDRKQVELNLRERIEKLTNNQWIEQNNVYHETVPAFHTNSETEISNRWRNLADHSFQTKDTAMAPAV